MGMLGGNPPIQIYGLDSSFKYEENNSMLAEAMEGFEFESAEEDYENPGEHTLMGCMDSGGESHEAINAFHWLDQKYQQFTRPN